MIEKKDKICFVIDIPKNEKKDLAMIDRLNDPSVPFDILYLTEDSSLKKVLVRDLIPEMKDGTALNGYKFVVTVGAEPFKKILKLTGGVTRFAGTLVTDPRLTIPIMSPGIIFVNPAMQEEVDKQFKFISDMYHNDCDQGEANEKHYEHVDTMPRYLEVIKFLSDYDFLCADLETTAFDPIEGDIICAAITHAPHYGFAINHDIILKNPKPFMDLLSKRKILFHNAKFDKKWLKDKLNLVIEDFEDTLLVHYCFINQNKGTHGLKLLAMEHSDLGDYDRELDDYKKKWCRQHKIKVSEFNYGMIDIDILAPYACGDVDATIQVWYNMALPAMKAAHEDTIRCYNEILKPASDMLMELELIGAPVDSTAVHKLDELYDADIKELRQKFISNNHVARLEADQGESFNPNSFRQIGRLLFEYMGLPVQGKTATGNPSTDADTLKALACKSDVPGMILSLRKLGKMRGTYVTNILEMIKTNGRLRGNFNLCSTTSGRLSSSGEGD